MSLSEQPAISTLLSRRFTWISLVVLSAVCGCGDADATKQVAVFPVKGQVLLPDGKPLTAGRVVFVSKDGMSNSTGKIGEDGSFSLSTGQSGEGAPAGEYKIRIEPDESTLGSKGSHAGRAAANLPFPGKYTDEDSSELTATVKPEPNQLEPFKLTNTPPKSSSKRRRD